MEYLLIAEMPLFFENDSFIFLSLLSQILYWQNFACQFAKMPYLLNLHDL